MTLAICLKCGAEKIGALVQCRSCGFEPFEEEDLVKCVLLSDHYLSKDELSGVGNRIKEGQPISFDETSIQSLTEAVRDVGQDRLLGAKVSLFTCGVVVILGIMLGLVLMGLSYLFGK